MSNTMFKEKLKADIKKKIETLQEDKVRIERHESKLSKIKEVHKQNRK